MRNPDLPEEEDQKTERPKRLPKGVRKAIRKRKAEIARTLAGPKKRGPKTSNATPTESKKARWAATKRELSEETPQEKMARIPHGATLEKISSDPRQLTIIIHKTQGNGQVILKIGNIKGKFHYELQREIFAFTGTTYEETVTFCEEMMERAKTYKREITVN